MDFIDTFELRFPGMSHADVAARHPSSWRSIDSPSGNVSDAPPVDAFVDGSRWLAKCPDPVCGGAERANFSTGLFFCCECRNRNVGGDYLRVSFPQDRAAIEAVLLKRPDWKVRAWLPTETIEDLKAQNMTHGDPV